jgi:hypothetical protein
LRVDDMLLLSVSLHGLAVDDTAEEKVLRRRGADAILIAHFPPQAVAEEVFADTSPTDQPTPLPAGALPASARHAGPSRVAVRMPIGVETIAFSTEGVLEALAEWPLALVPRANLGAVWAEPAQALSAFAAEVARLLPHDRAERAVRVADRSARRAADAVHRSGSALVTSEALEALASDVASAAEALELDDEEGAALQLRAELGFASRVIDRDGPLLGVGGVLELLPGLFAVYSPREPAQTATAIELPYRLVQSPRSTAAFSHARSAITRNGRTELWHTRLGERIGPRVVDATETETTLAAIWSPDYGGAAADEPGFATSLTAQDRDEIVRLTSDETGFLPGTPSRRYQPQPSRARRLMLTALGGWLDVDGRWETRPANAAGLPLSLVSWKHHAALGRDWFVETARVGQLLPFGHRAIAVTLTERRFQDEPGGRVAVLRQRRFVEVREPLRTYPHPTQAFGGRDFPFRVVEILTLRTPNLQPVAPGETGESFWPRLGTPAGVQDFRFEIRATDIGGRLVRFDVPLRFVSDAVPVAAPIAQYNAADQGVPNRTTAPLRDQPVQLAPMAARTDASGAADPGDVLYPMAELRLGASVPTIAPPPGSPLPRFHPALRAMRVVSTTLAQLTGDDSPGEFAYAQVYRQSGFDPSVNAAEVLLSATDGPALDVDFVSRSADKAGGIVTPNFGVSGTSRAFGLVGGNIDLLAGGQFDPAQFFPSAKIFGGVDLKDILAPVVVALVGATVPKLRTTRTREKIETVFEHRVERVPKSAPLLRMNERGTSKLDIKASLTAYFKVADPSVGPIGSGPGGAGGNPPGLNEPDASAEATLTWFKLNFFGCIIVSFDSFNFKASLKEGVKPTPKIAATDGVVFGGPLAFVDDLRRTLSGSASGIPGFEATPILKPELTGVTVGVKLGLTKLPVGIFTLKNLMVSTAVRLPFDGKPLALNFGFAERANPFQLTVSLFGGGGFVVLGLDTENAVKEIEAALEFGAFAELDFGVASGAIYVKAGIYIYFNEPEEQTTLKGYVEMGGEVQVLGIVSVSITMHLSLGFYKVGTVSEVRGQATLVIEIEILFFSASVNLSVERRFAGTESDPTFADLIPSASVWDEYAEAFA